MLEINDSISKHESFTPFFAVGIGASAGGLNACRVLLRNISTPDACFILCQHLAPNHESKLVEILSKDTHLKVRQVSNGMELRLGYLFIAPPNADIEIVENHFVLTSPRKGPYPKPNINKFFSSLSENHENHAIAVILSGTGTDGASGISEVRAKGGVVLTQDPNFSDYDGMPNASIATHMVDIVGDPEMLGKQISKIISTDSDLSGDASPLNVQADIYDQILKIISSSTNIDFSKYKETTIKRRIMRRMAIKGIQKTEDYHAYLKRNTGEIWAFAQDAFIIVSEFYRDKKQFDAFKIEITEYIKKRSKPRHIRIWVAGCAMGEEAYTVAMILEDIKSDYSLTFDYKILATDISDKAIGNARIGQYSGDSIKSAPTNWLSHYFNHDEIVYEVKRKIRENVTFSIHNIFSDPPFSNIDIISCRNLLIYLDPEVQDQLIQLFNYSLNRNSGLLFLGPSESIRVDNLFKKSRNSEQIYQCLNDQTLKIIVPAARQQINNSHTQKIPTYKNVIDKEKVILGAINKSIVPALIVVDQKNTIIFTYGSYKDLLGEGNGFFDGDLFDMINPEIKTECRALLFKARKTGKTVNGIHRYLSIEGKNTAIYLSIRQLEGTHSDLICISTMLSDHSPNQTAANENKVISPKILIEQELSTTRDNLQTVIEQLETANEQLCVYNEELQSANEEYQSTNEELQTVNEELQSTNEELITVNEEHATKTAEQMRLSSDLNNLQESLDIPFLLINQEYRIKRFTRSCKALFDPSKIKIDDLFFAIEWRNSAPDFRSIVEKAKSELSVQITEVQIDSRTYQFQVSPYINTPGKFDGYTVIFYDTTDFIRSQEALRIEKLQAQTTLELIQDGVVRLNDNNIVEYVNPAALSLMDKDFEEIIGSKLTKRITLLDKSGEVFNLHALVQKCKNTNSSYTAKSEPLTFNTTTGKTLSIELSVVPLLLPTQKQGTLITLRDTTEKQKQLERLQWQSTHDALTGLVNRDEMDKRLDRAILASKRDGYTSSLLYLDLDQFKVINDTCGHLAGDLLLKQLAQLTSEMLRSRDTLARLGGDEFAILLDRCPIVEAESIAYKVQQKICDYRFSWEDKLFRVGVSIGIVGIDKDVNQITQILSDADAACYAAKESGGNVIQVHSKDNKTLEIQRSQMRSISDINEAIENDFFRLYFHQIRDINTKNIVSWEVLIRMFNKSGELLLPEKFLTAAERFGIINRIDSWVIESSFRSISQYFGNSSSKELPNLNINLSANTITDISYLNFIVELSKKNNISPESIHFEITETAAVRNLVKAREFMTKAKDLGFKFSLDDFGTGMSSLSYLRELPIDTVKIDKSFVANITQDPVNRAIVASVKEVAHLLNLQVIAEGVEKEEQLKSLKDLGVDAFQGFLLGKPLPFEEFVNAN